VTTGIGSPSAASDSTTLADWLELKALASHDGNSSFQDLVAEFAVADQLTLFRTLWTRKWIHEARHRNG
jgi:hypothetical protein